MTEAVVDATRQEQLTSLAAQVRPTVLAAEQLLPVAVPLGPLLPDGGLRRGSVLVVRNSMSLLVALAAEASGAGAWVTAVSLPDLGMVAAAEQDICLDRFPLVPAIPPARWVEVVAMLADSLQIILAAPPATLGPRRRVVWPRGSGSAARCSSPSAIAGRAGRCAPPLPGPAAGRALARAMAACRPAWSRPEAPAAAQPCVLAGRGCGHRTGMAGWPAPTASPPMTLQVPDD